MNVSHCLVHGHSTTALFTESISLVGSVHVLFGEDAVFKVKVGGVEGDQLGKEHVFRLLHSIAEIVTIHEHTPLGSVSVQIDIKGNSTLLRR